jgi:hypothetical protein
MSTESRKADSKMRVVLCARTALALALSTAACVTTTPGSRPHDMSASQHEAMAEGADKSAELHAAQYAPDASEERCIRRGSAARDRDSDGCWTMNATAEHLADASKQRKIAADHRAASEVLRTAEARACAGLSDDDRDMSPFFHRDDIAGVEALNVSAGSGKSHRTIMEGAVVTFRPVPGMTAQWLQRVVDCHVARNAALGHDLAEMPYCPLVLNGVTARVTSTPTGLAVAVSSEDSGAAQQILDRSRALVGR